MSSLDRAYRGPMRKVTAVRTEKHLAPRRVFGARERIRVVMTLDCGHELARDFTWTIRRDYGNGGATRVRADTWAKVQEAPCIACGPRG